MVLVEGAVVIVSGVLLEGELFPDGVAEGAEAEEALTLTESFMPLVQCPATEHMK